MYHTYLVRPSGAPEGRGPDHKPFWDTAVNNYNLRGGFTMQLLGTLIMYVVSLMFCSSSLLGAVVAAGGALWIQSFRSIADDDGGLRHTRGYRAGIKALHQASILDFISWAITVVHLLSLHAYFDDEWTKEKIVGKGLIDVLPTAAHLIHGIALILYATSIFMLESFHHEGTSDGWAWVNGFLFKVAGLLEIVVQLKQHSLVLNGCFRVLFIGALMTATAWATVFEPLSHRGELKLTQGALQTELYKTKNAAAFYGRPQE